LSYARIPPLFSFSPSYYTLFGQDVTVRAGNKLTWDWTVFGEATETIMACREFCDDAFFIASNGSEIDYIYAPRASGVSGGSFTFDTEGKWTLMFGVSQIGDNEMYSALLLDGVQIEAPEPREAPEPKSLALVLLALSGAALVTRRQLRSTTERKSPQVMNLL
jgi:hypothetical protein